MEWLHETNRRNNNWIPKNWCVCVCVRIFFRLLIWFANATSVSWNNFAFFVQEEKKQKHLEYVHFFCLIEKCRLTFLNGTFFSFSFFFSFHAPVLLNLAHFELRTPLNKSFSGLDNLTNGWKLCGIPFFKHAQNSYTL